MAGLIQLFLAGWFVSANAQFFGWAEDQVNTSICSWEQPRAALIRDTIYIDGGDIWWSPGLSDGRVGTPTDKGNLAGTILTYNLSYPFDSDTNITGILLEDTISKAIGGEGNANGAAPNFRDGGMLANDAGFFLFGGALFSVPELYDAPDEDWVLSYQTHQYGPEKEAWQKGFNPKTLQDDVSRYISYGAAVNAPSENKAWYFSGMTAPGGDEVYANVDAKREHAAKDISNSMVELDMKEQNNEKWSNRTLSGGVKGRANAEVVWVPVGEEGILVALGGVVHPDFVNPSKSSDDKDKSEEESPKFMEVIDVYDVANDEWYQQPTKDGPGARTRGCAVVAPAEDSSSFNIYYYGGYEGLDSTDDFYDDVWVLSLPSFTWTELSKGTPSHARAGHKCFMPYPDQMMVFGGYRALQGMSLACLEQPVAIYNLSSGEWMDSYHPDEHGDYAVPDKVLDKIGGDATGGATATTPATSGWVDDGLEDLFSVSYDMDKITTWGPYTPKESGSGRPELPGDDNNDDDGGGGGSGLPSWVAPVLGVILGLMLVTAAIVVFCLWRRRKIFKNRPFDDGTEDAGSRILSWMRGQPTDKAATTTTSEGTPGTPTMTESKAAALTSTSGSPRPDYHGGELAGTPIAELDDTSPPAELSDRALTPEEIVTRHSHLASDKTRSMSRSYSSFSRSDVDSTTSSFDTRLESPVVPNGPAAGQGQMRSLSETLAQSSSQNGTTERPSVLPRRESDQLTPVSPPTAVEPNGEDDYLTARAAIVVSPLRRSVFHEHDEEDAFDKSRKG